MDEPEPVGVAVVPEAVASEVEEETTVADDDAVDP